MRPPAVSRSCPPLPAPPRCEPPTLSSRTARTWRLSAREGAHPQFPNPGIPSVAKEALAHARAKARIASTRDQESGTSGDNCTSGASAGFSCGAMVKVEFWSCRCRGFVRANSPGRVPPLPAPHPGVQGNHLTALRQKKSREGAAREARCWLTWKMALDVLPCLRRLQVLSAACVRCKKAQAVCRIRHAGGAAVSLRSAVFLWALPVCHSPC